jgi:hypothetical protein
MAFPQKVKNVITNNSAIPLCKYTKELKAGVIKTYVHNLVYGIIIYNP